MNRRQFLAATGALGVWPRQSQANAESEQPGRPSPYVAYEKYLKPGSDEFAGEKKAQQLSDILEAALRSGSLPLAADFHGHSISPVDYHSVAEDLRVAVFSSHNEDGWSSWLMTLGEISRASFFPLPDDVVQFEIASKRDGQLYYTTGSWHCSFDDGRITSLRPVEQFTASGRGPLFRDVTVSAFANTNTLRDQLSKGIPYWRSRLDPATGIDLYGSNGICVGDIDNDGVDEVYVCQPGGLPNRLLKFKPDGTLIDISEQWLANMLDDTSAALFLDLRNSGHQDLLVLRSSGPVLLLNEQTHFRIRTDAFHFNTPPQGGFTGMASADYNCDGKLDVYFCCYVYFQSEAQYTYAAPYHDARNGPPNFLFRNELNADGTGLFVDVTTEVGLNENNNRFSFAPAWCDFNDDGWPDLYVANDFGRKNFYVNNNGHFHDKAAEYGVEDIGPGMSAAWFQATDSGQADLYVANMWTAAGQRITHDANFIPAQQPENKNAYLGHTMGNSLFVQDGSKTFANESLKKHVAFGKWAWAAGGHDLDNDGVPEIFVTCGMLSNQSVTGEPKPDLSSFFWRQVVNKSPQTAETSIAYQEGWNALNQYIREDYSWNGHESNVLHVKRADRFYDFSGVSGLDFADDSRAFSVMDFDGDGRPDVILKSRLGPQVRLLQNNCAAANHSIAFRLQGTKSNRDAIGARIEVDGQTKWLSAGSEFLSQHSKRMLFGLGSSSIAKNVSVKWPSGVVQHFEHLSAGCTYTLIESSATLQCQPFLAHVPAPHSETPNDNSLALNDTWFLEPVPLPNPQKGPGAKVLEFASATPAVRSQYEIFRRYLFDWRAPLELSLNLLLDQQGHAVKIYAAAPSRDQVQSDLSALQTPALDRAVPFPGYYISNRSRDFFKFGVAFLWAGFYAQALPYLEQVLERTPNNLRTLLLTAEVTDQLNLTQKSEALYRKALRVDANSAQANNGLGLALGKSGKAAEARQSFEKAIEIKRDYAEAINNLGVLFTQQGQLNDAIAAFQYGISVAPDEDILYLNLGRAFIQVQKPDRARGVMQQLLEKKPNSEIAKRALEDLARRN